MVGKVELEFYPKGWPKECYGFWIFENDCDDVAGIGKLSVEFIYYTASLLKFLVGY